MRTLEILAPVGSEEMLAAAVFSGADSIYCGLETFNARRNAANFSAAALANAVAFCHARNVRVNVTLNTLLYDAEMPAFIQSIRHVCDAGADAVIVQDMAAAHIVKTIAPELELHGSTQMAVHTLEGTLLLKQMGFTRVILARELSKKQIKYITENCGIETEIFVHGALCVSLSGQCYMSAFLGGRSGNRGRCAGTCRLPFSANNEQQGKPVDTHLLSLKDLSLIEYLPELAKMGVASVKVEGRMRTPEYVAAAVNACTKALANETPDKQMLLGAFSRSGFTDGFYQNELSKEMFGVRTQEDMRLTKETLPQLRELYRREMQSIPVEFDLKITPKEAVLYARTSTEKANARTDGVLVQAHQNNENGIRRSLSKTGGTPFFAQRILIENSETRYIPLSVVNELRKQTLAQLLTQRERPHPCVFLQQEAKKILSESVQHKREERTLPALYFRFEKVSQMPNIAADKAAKLIFPIEEMKKVPEHLRSKTILELPRAMFEGSETVQRQIEKAKALQFAAFEAGNIGHIQLLADTEIYGGFTLNISNILAVKEYAKLGLKSVTLSPEISLQQASNIYGNSTNAEPKIGLLAYGHLPLMLTKACPLQNRTSCENCAKQGTLKDRKDASFPVLCKNGARHIYNPVPLYMGDRLSEVKANFITLYFSVETKKEAQQMTQIFIEKKVLPGAFTRGLYYKGAE